MSPGLLQNVRIDQVKVNTASGTSAVQTDAVDMQGFQGVVFVGGIVTADAANTVKLAQADQSGGSYADLAGTEVNPSNSGEPLSIQVHAPEKRFVRAEFTRGVATALETVYAIRYGGRTVPETNLNAESHVSPDEGTA